MHSFCEYGFSKIIDDDDIDMDAKLLMMQKCIDLSNVTNFDINYNDSEALFIAITNINKYVLIKFLAKNGINVCAQNNRAICKYGNNIELVQLLILYGADPLARNNKPISVASNIDTIKFLISLGADPFAHNNKLFCNACAVNDIKLVNFLISIGASCIEPNNRPICLAYYYYNVSTELKKLLLDNGADPNMISTDKYYKKINDDESESIIITECILDKAIHNCDLDGCKLLLEYGADINLCNFPHKKRNNIKKIQPIVDLFMEYGKDILHIMD